MCRHAETIDTDSRAAWDGKTPGERAKFMRVLSMVLLSVLAGPALAHHPLTGLPMETFQHGLLSGIGHPLLGFDHLFFVLLVGVGAHLARVRFLGVGAYLSTMLAGCLLVATSSQLPGAEALVALSLVVMGLLLATRTPASPCLLCLLFAAFGLFHGGAFGNAIAGQEAQAPIAVLTGYLLALGATQALLAVAAGWVSSKLSERALDLGGAMAAGAGLLLCLDLLETAILS
jgi:urease accessory protein